METMAFVIFTLCLLICGVKCGRLQMELRRHKRWDNNGDMNNNGDMSNMFRGTAGIDYPDLKTIPTTDFRCDDQVYEGGLYADVQAQCQVYHICHDGRKDSFLCGRGTIFNQEILACDYWYSTECEKAPSFYYVNSQIGNSGSSGNPQPGANQHDTNNFQDFNYRSNNPSAPYQGDNVGNRGISQPAGTGVNYNQPAGTGVDYNQPAGTGVDYNQPNANKEDCCCQKFSYKTPWAFPSS